MRILNRHDPEGPESPIPERSLNVRSATGFTSLWIIIGFLFWIGFYLGAVIMHATTK